MMENKLKESNIVSYGRILKCGLRDKEHKNGEPVIEAKREYGFGSLIPSRNNSTLNLPIVATFNREDSNGHFIRGVVEIKGYNTNPDDNIIYEGYDYDFIDGFDHGLARVYKIIDGKKKWGVIGLVPKNGKYEVVRCKDTFENGNPKYDNLWNFYDKDRKHIPAYFNGIMEDLSLERLREDLRKKSNADTTNEYSKKEKSSEDHSQEDDFVTIGEIGVRNYKRFSETTTMDLSSRITFIVGKNNAGKSSLLDAVEMFMDNLYHFNEYVTEEGDPYFCFAKDKEKAIQDELFKDYLNRDSSGSKILLSFTSGEWHFEIQLDGKAERNSSLIDLITISNKDSKVEFKKGETSIWFEKEKNPLTFKANGRWIFHKDDNKSGLEGLFYYLLPENVKEGLNNSVEYPNIFEYVAEKVSLKMESAGKVVGRNNTAEKINRIKNSIDKATTTSYNLERLHVFASIGKKKYENRNISLSVDNKEYNWNHGFVSESICDYYSIDNCTDPNNIYHQFVCKWLKWMEMGEDFVISKEEEEYTIKIDETDLCYVGSGTIHFVALCFKLLFLVDRYKKSGSYAATLLIEEPEQNLHPMLQSHMANFLLDVSDLYTEISNGKELKMVVETHSEYIIKRSQVTARRFAKSGQEIPFRTYYFPTNRMPYDMVYTDTGRFKEEFDHGFTDESSILSFQLL